jgi:hypothetical protein
MYTSEKLEKLKSSPVWAKLVFGGCGVWVVMLLMLGDWKGAVIAGVFSVAGWATGYTEAERWFARIEEERQLWWENRYLRQREGKSDE